MSECNYDCCAYVDRSRSLGNMLEVTKQERDELKAAMGKEWKEWADKLTANQGICRELRIERDELKVRIAGLRDAQRKLFLSIDRADKRSRCVNEVVSMKTVIRQMCQHRKLYKIIIPARRKCVEKLMEKK